jgi:hypothetical protein
MSTLSKLFVVMILVLALVLLGVNATLFAMRADFKHKFVTEANFHHQTQAIKAAEIADYNARLQLVNEFNNQLKTEKEALAVNLQSMQTQYETQRKENEENKGRLDRFQVEVGNLTRSYDVLSQSLADKEAKLLEAGRNLAKALNDRYTATNELQYSRQEAERLVKDLGALEVQYQDLARDKQRMQETISHLNSIGIRTDVIAPRKALQAQVTAVAAELDLVVISIGRDAGVNEGDEFTVYRGGTFVGKIAIDRVDRAWASGRIVLKGKEEPRIGDQASNNVLATPGKSGN